MTSSISRPLGLLAAAAVLTFGLAGCTPVENGLFNEEPVAVIKTAAPSPTPTVVPLGGPLDKEAALDLRREMDPNGDFAYQMPDATWVKTNRFQPLPGAVMADQQAKALAIPSEPGTDFDAFARSNATAKSYFGQFGFYTGKGVVYVTRMMWADGSGSRNALQWAIVGPLGANTTYRSSAIAHEAAVKLVAAQTNPGNWEIIVGN